MAKIIITGNFEPIFYDNDKAISLRAKLQTGEIKQNEYIEIGGFFGKASNIKSIIIEEEAVMDFNKSNKQRDEYEKQWEREQDMLRAETPENKAKRCFYAYYITYFLLRVGYSSFLGDDWKDKSFCKNDIHSIGEVSTNEDKHYIWKTFPKLFKERYPQVCTSLFSDMIKYFKENVNAIWCDSAIYKKHLPEKTHHSLLFDGLK